MERIITRKFKYIVIFLLAVCSFQAEGGALDKTNGSHDAINNRCYDALADQWDRFPFKSDLPRMIKEGYHPALGNKVLDIGSGTGIFAAWLQESGFDVLCLDPSDEMVKRTRAKGLKTYQMRIQDFQSDEQFAAIFAILSLIHVPKKEFDAVLSKIANLLPEGGLLVVGMIGGNGEGIEGGGFFGYPRFFSKFKMKELKSKFSQQFTVKEAISFEGPVQYYLFLLIKTQYRNDNAMD